MIERTSWRGVAGTMPQLRSAEGDQELRITAAFGEKKLTSTVEFNVLMQ